MSIERQMKELVRLQLAVEKLPSLSDVEQVKFDLALSIDQLYYSSKVEGVELTAAMINFAINPNT
jgi:hypothetical protein